MVLHWKQLLPDMDLVPVQALERLTRIIEYVDRGLESKFAEFGISRADWQVLAALFNSGEPYRVTQRELMRQLSRTSGGMSLRIDALVQDELVIREHDADDRRSMFVVLTKKGLHLTQSILPQHLKNQSRMLSGLSGPDAKQLAALSRKWMFALESEEAETGAAPLGLTILSPQASLSKRRAVGLPDVPGLLVQSVEADSRAAIAGVRRGDLILRVDETRVESIAAFVRAARRSRPKTKTAEVLRGAESLEFQIDCSE